MDKELEKRIAYPSIKGAYTEVYDGFQERETGRIRERTFFAWFPVWLAMQDFIPVKGCQFTWLKKVKLTDKEIEYRISDFDGGWTFQEYWKDWKTRWITIKIERVNTAL